MSPNGNFELGKPPKTGGIISEAAVAEQMLYEVGNPARYMLPDVNCDFTQVQLNKGKNIYILEKCVADWCTRVYTRNHSEKWIEDELNKAFLHFLPIFLPFFHFEKTSNIAKN